MAFNNIIGNIRNNFNSVAKKIGSAGQVLDNHIDSLNSVTNILKPVTGGSLISNFPGIRPLTLAAQGKYVGAAANVAGGQAGEIGADIASRAGKTAQRAYNAGLKSPKQLASATARGTVTGLIKNRRNIGNVTTGGILGIGENINNAVKKHYGNTAIGNKLTTDISAPIYNKLGIRKKLKTATGGFFYMSNINLINF